MSDVCKCGIDCKRMAELAQEALQMTTPSGAFTDAQIADLNKEISFTDGDNCHQICLHCGPDIKALLRRLEAAEKCVELCSTDENCCAIPEFGPKGNVADAVSWLEIWKRSKGE